MLVDNAEPEKTDDGDILLVLETGDVGDAVDDMVDDADREADGDMEEIADSVPVALPDLESVACADADSCEVTDARALALLLTVADCDESADGDRSAVSVRAALCVIVLRVENEALEESDCVLRDDDDAVEDRDARVLAEGDAVSEPTTVCDDVAVLVAILADAVSDSTDVVEDVLLVVSVIVGEAVEHAVEVCDRLAEGEDEDVADGDDSADGEASEEGVAVEQAETEGEAVGLCVPVAVGDCVDVAETDDVADMEERDDVDSCAEGELVAEEAALDEAQEVDVCDKLPEGVAEPVLVGKEAVAVGLPVYVCDADPDAVVEAVEDAVGDSELVALGEGVSDPSPDRVALSVEETVPVEDRVCGDREDVWDVDSEAVGECVMEDETLTDAQGEADTDEVSAGEAESDDVCAGLIDEDRDRIADADVCCDGDVEPVIEIEPDGEVLGEAVQLPIGSPRPVVGHTAVQLHNAGDDEPATHEYETGQVMQVAFEDAPVEPDHVPLGQGSACRESNGQ